MVDLQISAGKVTENQQIPGRIMSIHEIVVHSSVSNARTLVAVFIRIGYLRY